MRERKREREREREREFVKLGWLAKFCSYTSCQIIGDTGCPKKFRKKIILNKEFLTEGLIFFEMQTKH